MSTAKTRSKAPTVTDDALPDARVALEEVAVSAPETEAAAAIGVEVLDGADEDPYSNIACTD